ncbi:MAG: hypothetical protein EAZ35_01850 [Sphingobacteriia bacterium]|jgi:outer membrane protein TolC|nr:MAG: hypothetical protein EAZ41_05350 [Sphingobacteriia bacterium]TAG31822.1 MAG: hypothetical protein EAZ35_01850 [Sphingobacteriia bacterium]
MSIIGLYKNNPFSVGTIVSREKPRQKRGIVAVIFIVIFVFSNASVKAQESMIPELSYPFLEKLIFTAKQNYPRMKVNQRKINFAELTLKRNRLSWFDFFTISAFYSPSTSVTLTNATLTGIQIGAFINISNLVQKPTILKQNREEIAIAKLQFDEYALTIESEVKSRYFRYMQQLTILRIHNQNAIDFESLVKQIKFKFERGEDSFENYSKALVQNGEQKQKIIETEGSVLVAKTILEELVGKKLEEVK